MKNVLDRLVKNSRRAIDDGIYEFSYLEIVKAAGHSCPTVAGAYLMTLEALKSLYAEQRAIRGDIKVSFYSVMCIARLL